MKKMLVTIVVLSIIFIGMVVRRNQVQSNSSDNVTIEEISAIEEYISKIYMWKEITNEALPRFEEINQASDEWIWQVVKKNIGEDSLSYEQIQMKAKELFGDEFQKQFPKQGLEGIINADSENSYGATSIIIDEKEDNFLLYNISKNDGEYEVEIIEYLEDHIEGIYNEDENQEYDIILRNVQDEEIEKVKSSESEAQIKELVKAKIDKYSKKKIILKRNQEGNLNIKKVE